MVLFTHWDEYLKNFGNQSGTIRRFSRRGNIDWKEKFEIASAERQKMLSRLTEAVESNTSRKKPQIVGVCRAAILSDTKSKMEDVLDCEGIVYPQALNFLFSDMVEHEVAKGKRYRVVEGIEDSVSIDASQFGKQNISALYTNLVNECKGLKSYASTVRACNRKWCYAGDFHKSYVVANEYGFQNITTLFVQEIRNYAMLYVKKLNLNVVPFLLNKEDKDAFIVDLMTYWTNQQNVGREEAKMIGNESYAGGFTHSIEFKYQYQRFEDMLQYAQDNYFIAKSIPLTVQFESCLLEATKKCIRDFVDSKCIMVY